MFSRKHWTDSFTIEPTLTGKLGGEWTLLIKAKSEDVPEFISVTFDLSLSEKEYIEAVLLPLIDRRMAHFRKEYSDESESKVQKRRHD